MATIRIAVQGFNRLGRSVFKIAHDRNDVVVAAIRDDLDAKTCAYLLKHDSVYGDYSRAVAAKDAKITVGDDSVVVASNKTLLKDVWREHKIDVVIDTTGASAPELRKHINAGARQVIAQSSEGVESVVMGVNDDALEKIPNVLGGTDGATNGITPVLSVLDRAFTVKKASVVVVDGGSSIDQSIRTKRTSVDALIPAPFVGMKSVELALPQSSTAGVAVHAPVSSVGLAIITAVVDEQTTAPAVNQLFAHAAKEPFYQGIITTTNKLLVSADFRGTSYSATLDENLTTVAGGDLIQLAVWFDAEWGFANRLVELSVDAGRIARSRDE